MSENKKTLLIQAVLFLVTIYATTASGRDWMGATDLVDGLQYSIPFLGILTFHEFGHYFTARYHHVKSSLPYYIPMYFGGFMMSIGTMGAFIRMKSPAVTTRQIFDIGIAGPLAGFVVALLVLVYGFTTLPSLDYLYNIHEEYRSLEGDYKNKAYNYSFARYQDSVRFEKAKAESLIDKSFTFKPQDEYSVIKLGDNLLFTFFKEYVADASLVPSSFELYHYPFLFAGFLALFFTSLNLMPIGQLDGGHILYGLIGKKAHDIVSPLIFIIFIFYGGLGIVSPFMSTDQMSVNLPLYALYLFFTLRSIAPDIKNVLIVALSILTAQLLVVYFMPDAKGFDGWLVFGFVLGRFLGIYHPPAMIEEKLGIGRQLLGWLTLVIFVLCFTPEPFQMITFTK